MKLDIIDKYLAGEMTTEERLAFEQEMERDPKLKEDVHIIAYIIHGIRQVGLEEENKRLQRIIASSASDKRRYVATIAAIFIAGFIIAATISVPVYHVVVKPLIEKINDHDNQENNELSRQNTDSVFTKQEVDSTTVINEEVQQEETADTDEKEKTKEDKTKEQQDKDSILVPNPNPSKIHINPISKIDENGTKYELINAYYENGKLTLILQIVNNNNDRDLVFDIPTILDDKGNQHTAISMKLDGQNKKTFSLNRTQVLEMILSFKIDYIPNSLQELRIKEINSWPIISMRNIHLSVNEN